MTIHINSYRFQQEYSPETKYFKLVGKKSSERCFMSLIDILYTAVSLLCMVCCVYRRETRGLKHLLHRLVN